MRFLIDGYNLMHALGLARPRGPGQLARCRADLIDWLARTHDAGFEDVAVIFDGRGTPGESEGVHVERGMQICFSMGRTADDVIEDLIARENHPRRLTVVSNDRRIFDAARRRDCMAWSCDDYLDWATTRGQAPPKPPPAADKPESPSPAESEHWKKEFADLDADPQLREFNQPFEDFFKS
jgi:uncharacterized protein